jgi:hypothetical protein
LATIGGLLGNLPVASETAKRWKEYSKAVTPLSLASTKSKAALNFPLKVASSIRASHPCVETDTKEATDKGGNSPIEASLPAMDLSRT